MAAKLCHLPGGRASTQHEIKWTNRRHTQQPQPRRRQGTCMLAVSFSARPAPRSLNALCAPGHPCPQPISAQSPPAAKTGSSLASRPRLAAPPLTPAPTAGTNRGCRARTAPVVSIAGERRARWRFQPVPAAALRVRSPRFALFVCARCLQTPRNKVFFACRRTWRPALPLSHRHTRRRCVTLACPTRSRLLQGVTSNGAARKNLP